MNNLTSIMATLVSRCARLALLIWAMTGAMVSVGQVVALDSAVQGQYLGEYMTVWRDTSGTADLQQVMEQNHWQPVNDAIPNYGHASDVFWFRLELQAARRERNWVLVISNPLIDLVDVYGVDTDGDRLSQYSGGAQRKQTDQAIRHRYWVVPIRMSQQGILTYYIRVESDHSVQLPVAVWPLQAFAARDERDTIITGALLGALFIMLLYNLFLYTTLRDPIYLAYVGSVFGFMMLQVSVKGFGQRFLWPDQYAVSSVAVFVSAYVTIFFATTFASGFMRLRERGFRLMPLVEVCRWGALACALLVGWIPNDWRLYLMVFLGILPILLGFIAIFSYYRTDDRPIQIFAAGWIVLLIGSMLFLLNKLGWVSVNVWTEQTMSVGTIIEVILFSMALGDRINNEKELAMRAKASLLHALNAEREEKQKILISEETASKAKEKTLQIRQDANVRLEQEIDQRTVELQRANEELSRVVQLDSLTGALNRHHFNESIHALFRQARESKSPCSLLMIDIDHFKQINDEYGHLGGDRCLTRVASVLKRLVQGSGAQLWRFGGEEFAVLLAASDQQSAVALAQTIRAAMEATSFVDANGPRRITISIGVACLYPDGLQRPEQLVAMADEALYAAKGSGRNRVLAYQQEEGQHHG